MVLDFRPLIISVTERLQFRQQIQEPGMLSLRIIRGDGLRIDEVVVEDMRQDADLLYMRQETDQEHEVLAGYLPLAGKTDSAGLDRGKNTPSVVTRRGWNQQMSKSFSLHFS